MITWLTSTTFGRLIATFLISVAPTVERGVVCPMAGLSRGPGSGGVGHAVKGHSRYFPGCLYCSIYHDDGNIRTHSYFVRSLQIVCWLSLH